MVFEEDEHIRRLNIYDGEGNNVPVVTGCNHSEQVEDIVAAACKERSSIIADVMYGSNNSVHNNSSLSFLWEALWCLGARFVIDCGVMVLNKSVSMLTAYFST